MQGDDPMNKLTTINVDTSHPKIPKLVFPRGRMIMAAWEEPELFSAELRAVFRSLRKQQ
jgi:hypothetical protein